MLGHAATAIAQVQRHKRSRNQQKTFRSFFLLIDKTIDKTRSKTKVNTHTNHTKEKLGISTNEDEVDWFDKYHELFENKIAQLYKEPSNINNSFSFKHKKK